MICHCVLGIDFDLFCDDSEDIDDIEDCLLEQIAGEMIQFNII